MTRTDTDQQPTDLEALRHSLRHLGQLGDETVAIPGRKRHLSILRPLDIDRLLDLAAKDPEQNLPYWAEIWPSGIGLAAAVIAQPNVVRGQRVLELGCGLGVTAMAALSAGAELTVTDYAPDALALATCNCLRLTGRAPQTAQVNWRSPDAAFNQLIASGFPVVLAADVLYEARDVAPLVELAPRLVTPGGLLWLAEPGRRPARAFLDALRTAGWYERSQIWEGPWPDPKDEEVVVTVHELRRPLDNRSETGQ